VSIKNAVSILGKIDATIGRKKNEFGDEAITYRKLSNLKVISFNALCFTMTPYGRGKTFPSSRSIQAMTFVVGVGEKNGYDHKRP
jgi:hypothetical protein